RYSTKKKKKPKIANTFLCWLFIMVLHIGVAGAALATVIGGQALSASMSMYFFFFRKNRSYQIRLAFFKPDWRIMAEVITVGFPSFVKSLSAGLVVIITNNLLKSIGGDGALSVFAIAGRLISSLNTPQTGIVQGMQPILGYNFGQKKWERVRKTIFYSLGSSITYGLLVCGVSMLIPSILIGLLSREPAIITEGQTALRLMALAFPVSGISVMVAAYFQAVGHAREALVITLGGILLVKLPVLLLASSLFSLTGIWISEAISELILCVIALLMLRSYQEKIIASERLVPSPSSGLSD
ncbi:MAG TPA: MATE family efflux transporter, partial [Anaerolinea sp.]|nr:MATE family efflux transporter [Anaerolinea sp.]